MLPALTLAVATSQAPAPKLDGIALGSQVSALLRSRGAAGVRTTDIGHIWTWQTASGGTLRITTDDDGAIRLVDVAPAAPKPPHQADFAAAGTLPGTATPVLFNGYSLGSNAMLIIARQGRDAHEAFLGYRDQLERAGFLPNPQPARRFTAPVLQKLGGADYTGTAEGTAYVRITVGPSGVPAAATIYISSGDVNLDRIAIASALHDTFTPAAVDGTPAEGVYFRREDFIRTKPS